MTSDLFREEALAYQAAANSQFGETTGLVPPSWSHLTWLLGLFMAALFLFVFNVSFARKETVRGKLRFDGAEAKIMAIEPGLIGEVFVTEGQHVEAGQQLLALRSERFMTGGGALSAAMLASLESERSNLTAQREALERASLLSEETARLARRDAVRREAELIAQRKMIAERLVVSERRRDEIILLRDKGLIAEPVYNEREEAVVSLRQSLIQIDGQIADAVSARQQAETELAQVSAALDRDRAGLGQRLAQIDGQMGQTAAGAAQVLRAPQAGRVANLRARPGEQANPGAPLAIILPEGTELIADVYLPSRAAGFVEAGQPVKLLYDAFPYQKFGPGHGTVKTVSLFAQRPDEIGVVSNSSELLYAVSIRIDAQSVKGLGREFPLQAGMELSADIVLEDRRILDWLVEPLKYYRRSS